MASMIKVCVVLLSLSFRGVASDWWSWPSRSEFQKVEEDVSTAQSDIKDLKTKGDERFENLMKDIRILQLRLDVIPTTREASSTTCELVGLAKDNGIIYLLDTRRNTVGWGSHQNADAVMALRLADPERFSIGKSANSYDYIQGVNDMVIELKSQLEWHKIENDTTWAHGLLAKYVVGLTSACEDTQSFYDFDVASIVRKQFVTFRSFFEHQKFALSWVVLALCNLNSTEEEAALNILSENHGHYKFGIDEASMIVMALSCVDNTSYSAAQRAAEDFILNGIQPDGSFGNEYTTGLAIQALTRYSGSRDDVHGIVQKAQDWLARKVIAKFGNVELANQVLPALAGRSYADVKNLTCQKQEAVPPLNQSLAQTIEVRITVQDLISTTTFNKEWQAFGKKRDNLYEFMQNLEGQDPSFNFTVTNSVSFGAMIQSLVGIMAKPTLRQYWEFLQYPNIIMNVGISSTYPTNRDHYIFNLTTW